jgi:hypothetical protein
MYTSEFLNSVNSTIDRQKRSLGVWKSFRATGIEVDDLDVNDEAGCVQSREEHDLLLYGFGYIHATEWEDFYYSIIGQLALQGQVSEMEKLASFSISVIEEVEDEVSVQDNITETIIRDGHLKAIKFTPPSA